MIMTTIPCNALSAFSTQLFLAAGLSADHAETATAKLIEANILGIDSHGVLRIPMYINRLLSGAMNVKPELRVIKRNGAVSLLDADNAAGMIAGHETMLEALGTAEKYQVGICGAINSNHFGAAGVFARMASKRNMIGISMTNVAPLMTMPGIPKPLVGNNPFAIAIPVKNGQPIVLDISLSNVALGKILLAEKKGEKIPDDWATDPQGKPTTDPAEAVKGYLLPIAGHKGFGLALLVDLLCGVFTGGAFLHHLKGMYRYPKDPSVTAHMMIALRADALLDLDNFLDRVDEFKAMLKEIPQEESSVQVLWPGEPEAITMEKRMAEGIPLQDSVIGELNELSARLGLEDRLA